MIGSSLYLSGLKTKMTDSDVFHASLCYVEQKSTMQDRYSGAQQQHNIAGGGEGESVLECKRKFRTPEDAAQFAACHEQTGRTGCFHYL